MWGYALRRLLGLIPVLWVIVTLSFFIMRAAPGGPFDQDRKVSAEVRKNLEARYHLDEPLPQQYLRYLGQIVRGDLGPSFKYKDRSVNEIIALGFPVSLQLGVVALFFALLIGVTAGTIASMRQNSGWDHGAMAFAMLGVSVPNFVLGPLLIMVFALTLFWLPPGRWEDWRHMILPGFTLGAVYAAYIARLTRGGLLEVIRQDYVRTARAKGLPERTVLLRHTFRGGLLPVATYLGPALASLFTGSIVVERIFNVPGMGRYFVDGAINRDYTLVLGAVITYSVFLLLMNLIVDLSYGLLDPRVKYE